MNLLPLGKRDLKPVESVVYDVEAGSVEKCIPFKEITMQSRYALNTPLLVIGFTQTINGKTQAAPSLASAITSCVINDIPLSSINFHIREIMPVKEIPVRIDYTEDRLTFGYIAESKTPIIDDIHLVFANQYPSASYGQLSTESDSVWSLTGKDVSSEVIDKLKGKNIPWRYTNLTYILDELTHIEKARELLDRIMVGIAEEWKDYDLENEEFLDSGVFFHKLTKRMTE